MSAGAPPLKPWERNRTNIAGVPSANTASLPSTSTTTLTPSDSTTDLTASNQPPSRPWEQSSISPYGSNASPYSSPYGAPNPYGASTSYGVTPYAGGGGIGTSYGSSMYNSPYNRGMAGGTYGSSYGGYSGTGMYNRPMYGGGAYGASAMYGGTYGAGSMYGGMNGSMYGGPTPYGPGGMIGAPPFDPNNPMPAPPTAWQHFLGAINGLMTFFGRLSFLVDENAHAVHFFISALLQMLDRAGSLYGELARFILRLLGRRRRKGSKDNVMGPGGPEEAGKQLALPHAPHRPALAAPPSMLQQGGGQWDNLWRP